MIPVRQTTTTTKEVPNMKINAFADLVAAPSRVEPVGSFLAGSAMCGVAGIATA